MTTAIWCILIAALMPYFTTGIAKWGAKDFDNNDPRNWAKRQTGLRARATAAHKNHFETLPFFGLAVLIAQHGGVAQSTVDLLAMIFLVLRLLYTWLYISNRASMRSLVWALSIFCCIGLFIVTAMAR